MNLENISKVISVGNPRVQLLLSLLKQGYSLDHTVQLKVVDLGEAKDVPLDIIRNYLNTLGAVGIQKGILFPSKANPEVNIQRENARMAIVTACKKAEVKLIDLDLGLHWSSNKAMPVIPEIKTLDELMAAIKKIQEIKPKGNGKPQ